MNRKIVGVVAALVCALIGVAILAAFARGSGDEATLQDAERVSVLTLTGLVSAGTPAADLEGRYIATEVLAAEASMDRVVDLATLSGMVAVRDIGVNEVLEVGDFVDAASYARPGAPISVPPELLQASITLEPQRALGGQIRPGDKVAVIGSFANGVIPADESAILARADSTSSDGTPVNSALVASLGSTTHLLIHQALVTNVQAESLPAETVSGEGSTALSIAPTGNFVVSLGLPVADMERLIFAKEYGTLWMALEPDASVDLESSRVQHLNRIWDAPEPPTTTEQ